MSKIRLPYHFNPREYQLPFLAAIDCGIKRAILLWPRRHGKDKTCFNALVKQAYLRVGNYYYIFPEYAQGKRDLWDNIDGSGFKTMKHAPTDLVNSIDKSEMKIELINGSTIQIVGASNIDSIVGSNPVGIVFSEYSLIDPNVWAYIYPILEDPSNQGFVWFNFTPRGNNHAKKLYNRYKDDPNWFVQKLTARECHVFSEEKLDEIREEYVALYGSDELFQQEFNTSFAASLQGAYYGKLIEQAEKDNRVTGVPYDAAALVSTAWDLGINDTTAIWFYQTIGKEVHFIDYIENSGEPLSFYAAEILAKPYNYRTHNLPHDARARELQTGKSREQALKDLGLKNLRVLDQSRVEDGIDEARAFLSRCWFDSRKCERGLECLRNYHKEFDDKNKIWRSRPKHDWSSNGADAFRYTAISYKSDDKPRMANVRTGNITSMWGK